ncbi:MAG: hypothetical protein ACKOHK_12515 [Planctomycetia bacterium]
MALAAVGCTMCPDRLDYSGPVPNGSAPQNDFRARSGGILQLGAAPRPWPLIVKGDEQPAVAEPMPEAADEVVAEEGEVKEEEGLRQTVAVVGESAAEEQSETTVAGVPDQAVTVAPARLEPVPATVTVPPLPVGETPGWRARRR